MVLGKLVNRDFEDRIAAFGEVVNTRLPGEFSTHRKTTSDSVTVQSPTATNVAVALNQHLHTSFMVRDGDQTKAFQNLVDIYLHPAMLSVARSLDKILSGQVYQFLGSASGHLGALDGTNAESYLLDARQVLNKQKAYMTGRNLVLGTVSESAMLSDAKFIQAYSVGDEGTAMREANLGRKFGFDIFTAQNQPYVDPTVVDARTSQLNGALAVGAATLTTDAFSAAVIPAGSWVTVVGDDIPRQVKTTTGASTTSIALTSKLQRACLDNAVVTAYGVGTVNLSAGYAPGWTKEIVYTGFTNPPQVGQGVSFGTSTIIYAVIAVDTDASTILLDRPLEESATVANGTNINLLPAGSYNFAFHRDALTLVSRPLALPMLGTGARAGVSNYNGLSMRVTFTYDGNKQGLLCTVDTLLGVKVLNSKLGCPLLG